MVGGGGRGVSGGLMRDMSVTDSGGKIEANRWGV